MSDWEWIADQPTYTVDLREIPVNIISDASMCPVRQCPFAARGLCPFVVPYGFVEYFPRASSTLD